MICCFSVSVVRADSLPLNGELYLIALDSLTKRGVEIIGATATARRRTTATIEECDLDPRCARNLGKIFFGAEDGPVGHQITAVFGPVGKAKHDCLLVVAIAQVLAVSRVLVEPRHGRTRFC